MTSLFKVACLLGLLFLNTHTSQAATSHANRANKSMTLGVGLGGDGGVGTYGQVGIYADADAIVLLRSSASSTIFSGEAERLGLYLQSFLDNSFYICPGIVHRKTTSTDRLVTPVLTGKEAPKLTDRDFGIEISIGNQWQFSYLDLGIDWLGYYHPIGKLQYESDDLRKGDEMLLRLSLGISW